MRFSRAAVLLGVLFAAETGWGQTFRYASTGDLLTLDPHSADEALSNSFKNNVYEGLVRFNEKLEPEPALAVSWKAVNPTTWRFQLRKGVTFHDGTPFTADDVVFSYGRQRSKNSVMASHLSSIKSVRKIDDNTIEYLTDGPDPILLRNLTEHFIMSKKWSEQHATTEPVAGLSEETYATRHENGTGPFQVVERVPDTRTVLVPFNKWWDLSNKQYAITRAEFRPIANAATRLAALVSGEVDLAYPVAPQDVARVESQKGFRIIKRPELRVVFLGMDQWRDESLDMPGSKKNPFRDVRVRRAVYQAIDEEAIRAKVMRGMAAPTGLIIPEGTEGYDPKLRERYPYDPGASRKLLAEAGYPDGFPVTLDCPNDRYINDEAICQSLVPMLARVGVKVTLNAQTKSKHFDKILKKSNNNTSFFLLGFSPETADAMATLLPVMTMKLEGSGAWNGGRYTNPRVEELVTRIRVEMDPEKRRKLISEALRIHREDFGHLPLHEQLVIWGARDAVEVVPDPRDRVQLRFVKMRQ
ncbi:MAG TPA: ABC transporter substrate-binding protein [Myxococcaceae bacterium]|nr:ABC transporter substrate-binding protein [Myxococcaceae bacterium]